VGFCDDPLHKKLHRPENFCFPFMVREVGGVGRTLVATRDVEPLELVLWDGAAAMGPRMGGLPVCLQCLKPAKAGSVCSKCGWPVCGEKCENGTIHKAECSILAQSTNKVDFGTVDKVIEEYRCITPLRLLLAKLKYPEDWDRLEFLMDHNEDRRKEPVLWDLYQSSVNKFLQGCNVEFSNEDIDRATGLLWTNSFACAQGGGQAIFPTFSFASHSCIPNCSHSVFPNRTLALQTKVAVKAGQEFNISYISTMQGSLKRKSKLHDKWYFDCCCPRCSDPTELGSHASSLLCQVCKCDDALFLSTNAANAFSAWACTKCNLTMTSQEVMDVENRIATEMQGINNTAIEDFESFLSNAGRELHPNHYLMVLLKRHLVGLYSADMASHDTATLEKVSRYADCVESVYSRIDPGSHKERGTILRALCEVNKLLAKRYMRAGTINEEQFREKVEACVQLFQESQLCNTVRMKKEKQPVNEEE